MKKDTYLLNNKGFSIIEGTISILVIIILSILAFIIANNYIRDTRTSASVIKIQTAYNSSELSGLKIDGKNFTEQRVIGTKQSISSLTSIKNIGELNSSADSLRLNKGYSLIYLNPIPGTGSGSNSEGRIDNNNSDNYFFMGINVGEKIADEINGFERYILLGEPSSRSIQGTVYVGTGTINGTGTSYIYKIGEIRGTQISSNLPNPPLNSCDSNLPVFASTNIGNPNSINQSWQHIDSNGACYYSCNNGYLLDGNTCRVVNHGTLTYNYADVNNTFTIPFGITNLEIEITGGGGGGGTDFGYGDSPFPGEGGDKSIATLTGITEGDVLIFFPGGGGMGGNYSAYAIGGWGYGNTSGGDIVGDAGGAGGGASVVYVNNFSLMYIKGGGGGGTSGSIGGYGGGSNINYNVGNVRVVNQSISNGGANNGGDAGAQDTDGGVGGDGYIKITY